MELKKVSVICLLLLSGCMGDRALVVMPGTAMVLEKGIRGATVAAPDKNGELRSNVVVDLPPGVLIKVPNAD